MFIITCDRRIDATFISLNVITEEYEAARRVLVALQEVMSEEHALVHCNNPLHCSMNVCIYQENRDYIKLCLSLHVFAVLIYIDVTFDLCYECGLFSFLRTVLRTLILSVFLQITAM